LSISDLERVVLWDPITDGGEYLRQMRHAQEELVERNFDLRASDRAEARRDYGTYRLSEGMVEEFEALDITGCSSFPPEKFVVVSSSSGTGFPLEGVKQEVIERPCDWDRLSEDLINPHPLLERLIASLTRS
jgi:hypothetical protein